MTKSRSVRLTPPASRVPLAERGRMLFLKDVQALFGTDAAGGARKSLWWVKNYFAPEFKRKLGRSPYWWETEALEWLDAQERAG